MAIRPDLIEAFPADDVESIVPEGAVVALAVRDDLAVRPAHDDLQALDGKLAPFVEGFDQDADDLGAVGEVDVRIVALAAAHGAGVDGVPISQVLGDDGGVLLVDVSVFHFKILSAHSLWGGHFVCLSVVY